VGAVWFRFRAELRSRWQAVLGLALLAGIAGAATLGAAAGARRTDTAYSRLLADTNAWQVLVNPDRGPDSALRSNQIAGLPQVTEAGRVNGLSLQRADVTTLQQFFDGFGVAIASDGRAGYTIGRPKILEGRMPDPSHASDVEINPVLARQQHLAVGDHVKAIGLAADDVAKLEAGNTPPDVRTLLSDPGFGIRITLRVVAIGVVPEEIVVDQGFENPQMLLTPAFRARYPDVSVPFWGEVVRLRRGVADIPAFRKEVEALVPSEAVAFQTTTNSEAKVDRAVQPQVGALVVFALIMGLTGLILVGQALARQSFLDASDHPALRSLGCTQAQLLAVAMLRALAVAIVGAVVAVALAVATSPLMPIGAARTADPDRGVALDAIVLGLGAVAVFVAVLALAAVPAWRYARTRASLAPAAELDHVSRTAQVLSSGGAPPTVVAGVRMALEPGRGRTAVPVRTTLVSAALAIATVVAAVIFAASLDHLVDTPRLYGWNWDVQIAAQGNSTKASNAAQARVADVFDASPGVHGFSTLSLSALRLPGGAVTAVGVDGPRPVGPTLVSGRLPERDDEVALGERTLASLGVGTGDRVVARANNGTKQSLRVVGRVVLPGLGTYPGADKSSLGEGAVVTRRALRALGPHFDRDTFVVDFGSGATRAVQARVIAKARRAASVSGQVHFTVTGVQRPSDILSYDRVRSTPLALAAMLALLAAATVTHALVTSVRRRRRDFALLATLGFTRRQVSATVAWQATTVAAVALAVGVPIGIVLGRSGWTALADNLGTVSEPIVPIAVVLLAIPVVLALVNLVAFVPGRIAARLRPAIVLRSE